MSIFTKNKKKMLRRKNSNIEKKIIDRLIEPNHLLTGQRLEIALEIYKQKYELLRHLDRLRWYNTYIIGAICAGLVGFASKLGNVPPWILILVGMLLLYLSYTIYRIRDTIKNNKKALLEVSTLIGDKSIPQKKVFGASLLTLILSFLIGAITLVLGCREFSWSSFL